MKITLEFCYIPMNPNMQQETTPTKVLALAEEHALAKWLTQAFNELGYMYNVVGSAEEALTALVQSGFDVFVIGCDGSDGLELIEASRASFPQLPVIAMSSENDARRAVAAMKLGAADYLVKPLKAEELGAAIDEAIGAGLPVAADAAAAGGQQALLMKMMRTMVDPRMDLLHSAVKELENVRDLTLEVLGNSLDLKDSETEGHSKRVTAYTMALARAMGLPDADIQMIARGAYLHDIGKMAVPDAILQKKGPLTASERLTMQTHCERGYSIIRKIPYLADAAEIVYSHQEHYDGSGYPRGLKGDEIPLGARIFAVADTLDAITSDRPYRIANSFEYARREIERCAGTQLDPQVVEAFMKIPVSFWLQIREQILERQEDLY